MSPSEVCNKSIVRNSVEPCSCERQSHFGLGKSAIRQIRRMDASMNGIVRATSTSGSGMWSANAVAFTFPATNIIHDIFADDSRHTMFVQSGVLYTITNVQSGLVLHLPEDDDKTIVASRPSPNSITKSRQLWIPQQSHDDQWTFISAENAPSIGFEGDLKEGVNLITSADPNITKVWSVQPFGRTSGKFKISLSDTTFVTDLDTTQPGSLVRLSEASDDYGQVWSFTQGFTRD